IQDNQIEEAIELLQQGIQRIPPDKDLAKLYYSCADLLIQDNQIEEAIELLQQGIQRIPPDKDLAKLYYSCADLLAQDNQIEEAIALLQQGIHRIPQNSSLYIAYTNLLAQDNSIEEAIELLQQGIQRIPPDKDLQVLYDHCANLLAQDNRIQEAIELLQRGIQQIPPNKDLRQLYLTYGGLLARNNKTYKAIMILREGLSIIPFNKYSRYRLAENAMLYCLANKDNLTLKQIVEGNDNNSLEPRMIELGKVLIAQLQGDWQQAAKIAHQATAKFHNLLLLTQEAFSWLCTENIDAAEEVIQSVSHSLKLTKGNPLIWLKAFIDIKKRDYKLVEEMLIAYLDRPLQENETIDHNFLLYLWDTSVDFHEGINVAFNFPTLPTSLTGLEIEITRQQNDIHVLPDILNNEEQQNNLSINNSLNKKQPIIASSKNCEENEITNMTPKVFISYNHKDKDIVDIIKNKLRSEGINVVIDSEDLFGGQDIEEFIKQAVKNTDITLSGE
ncbi:MAG: tetratricopeptide repeat protein, partial [Xenococcus sp. MO_188.B8]|nr:tetratricopeptide repeat protein [Xenococcus sp. MO_188.B8]